MDLFDEMDKMQRPQVERFPWMDKVTMELVTEESLPLVIDACIEAKIYGKDLETTGLDTRVFGGKTVDSIVGICLAPSVDEGYYIPLRHMIDEDTPHPANLPLSLVNTEMLRLVRSGSVAAFHNGKYDTELLEFNGGDAWGHWDKPSQWHDSMILAQLRNSREMNKGLKVLSKRDLGREMIELKQLFPEGHRGDLNFSRLDPNWGPTIWYACADPMCMLGLVLKYLPEVDDKTKKHNQAPIYAIEKSCVAATRWMERNRLPIDRELVGDLIKIGQRDYMAAMEAVYASASEILGRDVRPAYFRYMQDAGFDPNDPTYPILKQIEEAKRHSKLLYGFGKIAKAGKDYPEVYDVKSQDQIGQMFEEMQVPGLKYTEKSKQVKTSADEIDRVIDSTGDRFPFMAKIKRFRENEKALSTYLIPLYRDSTDDGTLRVDFEAHKTDTGRFSTPGRNTKRMGGSLHGGTSYFLQGTPASYDKDRPECMKKVRDCFITRKVSDPEAIRQILEAGGFDVDDPQFYKKFFMGIDFSGVELRLVTNLSKEPKWIEEFYRCGDCGTEFDHSQPTPPFCSKCGSDKIGDLHSQTAMNLYGVESRKRDNWKFLRQLSKSINFALCYGGGGSAVRATFSKSGEMCSKEEGWRIKNQFDKAYPTLKKWWAYQHEFARKYKYVLTAFGRKYPLPDIDHEEGFFRSKAERNAINGPIQGSSADLTKAAMALIFKEFQKRGWLDKCMMTITMHDELCFECDGDILEEAIAVISTIMISNGYIQRKKWPVYLPVDVEIGFNWQVPWNYTEIKHGKQECPDVLKPFINLNKTDAGASGGEPDKSEGRKPMTHRVKDMSQKTADALSNVVLTSLDPDGIPLEVISPMGDEMASFIGRRIVVDPDRFRALAKDYGV